jgi:hypothetical protein
MSDDFEQRLTAAAQANREYELCGQRCADLAARRQTIADELASARDQAAQESKDVARLEHVSLTSMLKSLHGAREEALARERTQAEAARYKVTTTQAQLDAIDSAASAAQSRQNQLAGAPQAYGGALADMERHLTQTDDPRRAELLQLAGERGHLTAEAAEITRAQADARDADQSLAEVRDRLGSASNWATYDTFFRGGMISNSIKHDRMDQAAQAAAEADNRLAALRTELTDLAQIEPTAPKLAVSGGLKFADIFFNNIFTDLAIDSQIRQAQDNVERTAQVVADLQGRLADQLAAARSRLADIESRREALLTQQ